MRKENHGRLWQERSFFIIECEMVKAGDILKPK